MKLMFFWVPQVPMTAFNYPVSSLDEAFILADSLNISTTYPIENFYLVGDSPRLEIRGSMEKLDSIGEKECVSSGASQEEMKLT